MQILDLLDWKDHQKAFVLHSSNFPLSFLFALCRVHFKIYIFFLSSYVASQNLLAQCKRPHIFIKFPLMALKTSALCYSSWPVSLSLLFSGPLLCIWCWSTASSFPVNDWVCSLLSATSPLTSLYDSLTLSRFQGCCFLSAALWDCLFDPACYPKGVFFLSQSRTARA